jgi:hypothetical protein
MKIEVEINEETGEFHILLDLLHTDKPDEETVRERMAPLLTADMTFGILAPCYTIEFRPLVLQAAFMQATTYGSRGGG